MNMDKTLKETMLHHQNFYSFTGSQYMIQLF